ncbi:hypothetical protein PGQ11_001789 [Apiospora arundinis]|uniref:Uncharacterized protein n=1 Tax=Apiospora arundinis TaxID=335852 RepID=A0ABR2JGW3_9PEZI
MTKNHEPQKTPPGTSKSQLRESRLGTWQQDPSPPINHTLVQPKRQSKKKAIREGKASASSAIDTFDKAFGA